MRAWKVAAAAGLVLLGGAGVRLAFADEPQAKGDQDRSKVERELRDLEGQREKITSRIRELRKQLGLAGQKTMRRYTWERVTEKLEEVFTLAVRNSAS